MSRYIQNLSQDVKSNKYLPGDEPLLLSSDCCYRKTVGGILYNQVAGDTSQYPECKADCVYERDDEPGSRYCFQDGNINNAGGVAECKGES